MNRKLNNLKKNESDTLTVLNEVRSLLQNQNTEAEKRQQKEDANLAILINNANKKLYPHIEAPINMLDLPPILKRKGFSGWSDFLNLNMFWSHPPCIHSTNCGVYYQTLGASFYQLVLHGP